MGNGHVGKLVFILSKTGRLVRASARGGWARITEEQGQTDLGIRGKYVVVGERGRDVASTRARASAEAQQSESAI